MDYARTQLRVILTLAVCCLSCGRTDLSALGPEADAVSRLDAGSGDAPACVGLGCLADTPAGDVGEREDGGTDLDEDAQVQRCPVLPGSFEVTDEEDVAKLSEYCEISGDLSVANTALTDLSLPLLRRVGGDVFIMTNLALSRVRMPALAEVGGELRVAQANGPAANSLVELSLPSLVRVSGALNIDSQRRLRTLELPELQEVGTFHMSVDGEPSLLTHLLMPRLHRVVDSVTISNLASLLEVDLSALVSVGGALTVGRFRYGRHGEYYVQSNPLLERLDLPALESVGLTFFVQVSERLTTIEAPRLNHTGGLLLERNPGLETLALPALTDNEGQLWIRDNDALESADLSALISGGAIEITDNRLMSAVSFRDLESVHDLRLERNALTAIRLPSLREATGILVFSEPTAALELPALVETDSFWLHRVSGATIPWLERVGSFLHIGGSTLGTMDELTLPSLALVGGGVEVYSSMLTHVSFPVLQHIDNALKVHDNPLLSELRCASLLSIGRAARPPASNYDYDSLEVNDNPSLATLDLSQLGSVHGDCVVTGNSGLIACDMDKVAVGGTTDIPLVCQ